MIDLSQQRRQPLVGGHQLLFGLVLGARHLPAVERVLKRLLEQVHEVVADRLDDVIASAGL